ncbi:MAG: hypothetical protein HOQ01_07585, partial [Lysobacter sp.]|nr:hypothetical protein [Lysobacter sp.]
YIAVATTPAFALLTGYDYWTKQQQIHVRAPEHHNPAFLPWHREFLNRLELLLQEADPRVKLMYWQWTTDPTNSTGGVNLYTSGFMGNSGRGTGGTGMGAPLSPALEPIASESASVVRNLRTGTPASESDATHMGWANYRGTNAAENFSDQLERTPNHDANHGYIGGTGGSMSVVASATRDPFFFLLHGKADELWARWQRANTSRFEAATAYGSSATSTVIVNGLRPWNGAVPSGSPIDPWTSAGGFIVTKNSLDRSVLSPPIYDTAPLTVPALAPGQAAILEIPWYPPRPSDYACLGSVNQFGLLARVTPVPTTEGANVTTNVRNGNNLAWRNIQVVDDFSGASAVMAMRMANDPNKAMTKLPQAREVQQRDVQQRGVQGAQFDLVRPHAAWRVATFDQLPSDWTAPEFDDAKWPEAPAPLGFAPELEAMTGVAEGTKAAYFRKRFEVKNLRLLRDLTLRLRVVDGAVVYLNGREVHRANFDKQVTAPVSGATALAYFPVRVPPDALREGTNVLAIEVHRYEGDARGGLVFDAALVANRADTSEPPSVRIMLPDALVRAGQPMKVNVDAVDPNGQIRRVQLFVDDKPVQSAEGAATFAWTPAVGPQRLRAVAEDSEGLTTVEERLVVGVKNLPPVVSLQARAGDKPGTVILTADATDADGKIRNVEFFMADSDLFEAKFVPVGSRTEPPFEVTVQVPETEHRIVTVRVTDDGGESSDASTHVHVGPHRDASAK